jgi:DNA end-binding protein Ku
MARPYWSGSIQISLVSFGVKFYTATESKSEIRFHQIDRRTGERVRHQKVSSSDEEAVTNADIVKGYEYRKGEYVTIEPQEIEHLRIASKHTLDVQQFVDASEIAPSYFEKPYFVVPDEKQAEAFAVVLKALETTKKMAIGKIAFGGREHLVAIGPPLDQKLPGMMAYTLRYKEELRDEKEYFHRVKNASVESDQLYLAKELIQRKSAPFAPEKYKDEYEAALRELVESKMENKPLPKEEAPRKSAKVVNLMDALRRSVRGDEEETAPKATAKKTARRESGHGLSLVKSAPKKKVKARVRKSA